jgi:hypothetical protein
LVQVGAASDRTDVYLRFIAPATTLE